MASLSSKQKNSNSSCSTFNLHWDCMYWKTFFALIRFEGTLRCQDSSPSQALASRSTDTTATNHIGECPRKQLVVFCKKILCKSVQKGIVSLPNGGPPRDSQTGWFPRWPPKCQFRSWKFQFKLKLSHGVIVVETKKLQQQLFHLQSALGLFMYWKTFFALIRFEGTLRCQDSSPNQAPVSRFTNIRATSHGGMSMKTLMKTTDCVL